MRVLRSLATIGFVFVVSGAVISPSLAEGAKNDPGGVSATGLVAREALRRQQEQVRVREQALAREQDRLRRLTPTKATTTHEMKFKPIEHLAVKPPPKAASTHEMKFTPIERLAVKPPVPTTPQARGYGR